MGHSEWAGASAGPRLPFRVRGNPTACSFLRQPPKERAARHPECLSWAASWISACYLRLLGRRGVPDPRKSRGEGGTCSVGARTEAGRREPPAQVTRPRVSEARASAAAALRPSGDERRSGLRRRYGASFHGRRSTGFFGVRLNAARVVVSLLDGVATLSPMPGPIGPSVARLSLLGDPRVGPLRLRRRDGGDGVEERRDIEDT